MNNPVSAADPLGLMKLPPPPGGGGGGDDCWWCGIFPVLPGGPTPPQQPPTGPRQGNPNKDINKTWSKVIKCNKSGQQVMAAVQNDMGQFADNNQMTGFVSSFPDQPIALGNRYTIQPGIAFAPYGDMFMPREVSGGTLAVTVTSQSANGWTFTTDPSQHYFDGTVSFSSTDSGNGNIAFSITADANYVNPFVQYIEGPIIEAGENSNWNNMLNNVQSYCQSPIAY
jgi:hypothetical protein